MLYQVNMARISNEKFKSFLFMLAALAIAIGVQWDKHSLWAFLVPSATAGAFMGISWVSHFSLMGLNYKRDQRGTSIFEPTCAICTVGSYASQYLNQTSAKDSTAKRNMLNC